MQQTENSISLLCWANLNFLTKRRYDALLEKFGTLEDAWKNLSPELLRDLGCKQESVMKIMNEINELDIEQHQTFLQKKNITMFSISDDEYPDVLREIADPPVFLFARGNPKVLRDPSVAIVGTRAMSAYGKRVLEEMIPSFVHAGLNTVSGLALGVDATVAKKTIRAGGITIAVLGHGLGAIYPKENSRLAEEIVENGGLLLSEYPLHIRPNKYTFPARNRIIAGLSLGTIVAEAAAQSGSLITASLALEYGREVFAIPGSIFDPNMEGTHHLIQKSGAKLITSAEDVLTEFGVVAPENGVKPCYKAQTPDEQKLLTYLTSMPQSVDDLVEKTKMSVQSLNTTLTLMELKSGVKNVGAGKWVLG